VNQKKKIRETKAFNRGIRASPLDPYLLCHIVMILSVLVTITLKQNHPTTTASLCLSCAKPNTNEIELQESLPERKNSAKATRAVFVPANPTTFAYPTFAEVFLALRTLGDFESHLQILRHKQ
jgi:hypothetical protein